MTSILKSLFPACCSALRIKSPDTLQASNQDLAFLLNMSPYKPPYDPECEVVLNAFPKLPPLNDEVVKVVRKGLDAMATPEVTYLTDPAVSHEERTISGPGGPLKVSVLRSRNSTGGSRPAFIYMHGGGMILGSKLFGIGATFPWIKELDAVVISVEYRLAPEHPDPAPIEDCKLLYYFRTIPPHLPSV